jgi:hypothetical protein
MQSKKVSKKTQKNAEEAISASPAAKATSDTTQKPRTSRSSKSKNETVEATAAKHRPATVTTSPESSVVAAVSSLPAKTMVAAAGAGHVSVISAIVDPVGVEASAALPSSNAEARAIVVEIDITHDQISALAHSYWVARGHQHGNPDEDWLIAERELRSRR